MSRQQTFDRSAWPSLSLEGNLIAPAMVAKIDRREAEEQNEADYGIRKGLSVREEISLAFRVGQTHFDAFGHKEQPSAAVTNRFVHDFLSETFGFNDLADRSGAIGSIAGGRIPIVVVPPSEPLDRRSPTLSVDKPLSPTIALQDHLNERDEALWGIVTNGETLRLLRDNASLTRPAHIEANLRHIFDNGDAASFAALWLLLHRSRFGAEGQPAADCALERWRDKGAQEGEAARELLAGQVEKALGVLGSGFLEANPDLAQRLRSSELGLTPWLNELLRLVYRLIFLMVAEDRNLLHPAGSKKAARKLYADGYSMAALRTQSVRRDTWNHHHDRYEGMKIVFRALAAGECVLGLPALGGLFAADQLPSLESIRLPNRAFMEAVYRLSWLTGKSGKVPVNWRAMETEELGSVYESLLELQPQLTNDGRRLKFASTISEKKGSQRKTTGSYYTPDSLVQALLDSALDPVLERAEDEADPAEALLRLTVIDPACGSGHFLLAAARRIATRLARIRTDGTPSLEDYRHALRDVVQHCIHGVDRNPMAAELTKVALWIETMDPGRPLGFLDAQIRCGDALLGVFDLTVLEKGIPDAAYKPLTGDDKGVARHYAKKNKVEKSERLHVEEGFRLGRRNDLLRDFARMRAMPEDTLDQIAAKSRRHRRIFQRGSARWTLSRACDLYMAGFLAPKAAQAATVGLDGLPRRGAEMVPTSGTMWELLRGTEPSSPLLRSAERALNDARAFHWPLEFPDIVESGGFDVVLGNPPWERIKLQEQEFFAARWPEIANAPNKAARGRLIAALKTAPPYSRERALHTEFIAAKQRAEASSQFVRAPGADGGRFALTGRGDVNTYALFAELFATLVRGRAGVIVPSGIATDHSTKEFFNHAVARQRLVSLFDFENREAIFSNVHRSYKFTLLTLIGENYPTSEAEFAFFLHQTEQLKEKERRFTLSAEDFALFNPNTRTCPIFRTRRDMEVARKMYERAGVFWKEAVGSQPEKNPWGVKFSRMFDMSNDSGLFRTRDQLTDAGWELDGNVFQRGDERYLPLYESKFFHQYDHRFATFEGVSEKDIRNGNARHMSTDEKTNPAAVAIPRYWVSENEVIERLDKGEMTTQQLSREQRAESREQRAESRELAMLSKLARSSLFEISQTQRTNEPELHP